MKILFVCRFKEGFTDNIVPFNRELIESLRSLDHHVDLLTIKGSRWAYIKYVFIVNQTLKRSKYDLVHAVFGLSGLTICFQKRTPKVVSFIGIDINKRFVRYLSRKIVIPFIHESIFVSEKLFQKAGSPRNGNIIPFGVDINKFFPQDKHECKKLLGLDPKKKYILFSSRFDRKVKNAPLAIKAVKKLGDPSVELLEIKDIPDNQMNNLFNACEFGIMTSYYEGSPQFIKEVMSCNKIFVSTDVGDVKEIMGNIPGCYISDPEINDVAGKIRLAMKHIDNNMEINSRQRILQLKLDKSSGIEKVLNTYHKAIDRYLTS